MNSVELDPTIVIQFPVLAAALDIRDAASIVEMEEEIHGVVNGVEVRPDSCLIHYVNVTAPAHCGTSTSFTSQCRERERSGSSRKVQ